MSSLTVNQVVAAFAKPFDALGFKKRRDGRFTREIAEGVTGVISLAAVRPRREKTKVQIHPLVYNLHKDLGALFDELMKQKPEPFKPQAVRQYLTSLLPKSRRYRSFPRGFWSFRTQKDMRELTPLVADIIEKRGIRFLEKHSTLESIVTHNLENEDLISSHLAAAGLYLLGENPRAFGVIEREIRWLKTNASQEDVENFKRYARPLMKKMQAGGWQPPARAKALLAKA
ncbi:MAG: hypothetical protein QNJ30_08375 [Kiloniellales bacterium]|nr:hypothetical protein [Kiloniellales bacterium]